MAAAVDAAEERQAKVRELESEVKEVQKRIVEVKADYRETKEQLERATGDEKEKTLLHQILVAEQQCLAALEQQKLLLMQQQAGTTFEHTARVLVRLCDNNS